MEVLQTVNQKNEKQIVKLKNDIESMECQSKSDKSNLLKRIEKLENENHDLELKINKLVSEKSQAENTIQELSDKISEHESNHNQPLPNPVPKLGQVFNPKNYKTKLTDTSQPQFQNLQKLHDLETEIKELQNTIAQRDNTIEGYENQLRNDTGNSHNYPDLIRQLSADNNKLEDELEIEKTKYLSLQQSLKELSENDKKLVEKNHDLQAELDKRLKANNTIIDKAEDLRVRNEELEYMIGLYQKDKQYDLDPNFDVVNHVKEGIASDLDNLYDSLTQKVNESEQQIEDLALQITQLESDKIILEQDSTKKDKQMEKLRERNTKLRNQVDDMISVEEYNEVVNTLNASKQSKKKLKKEVSELQSKLDHIKMAMSEGPSCEIKSSTKEESKKSSKKTPRKGKAKSYRKPEIFLQPSSSEDESDLEGSIDMDLVGEVNSSWGDETYVDQQKTERMSTESEGKTVSKSQATKKRKFRK